MSGLVAGCSRNPEPSYPSDWPNLARATTRLTDGQKCPDLSGVYDLPKNAAAPLRGARHKGEFEFVHHFLGINSQHGRWLGMPARMKIEGPDQTGLKITFYRPNGDVTIEGSLQIGRDFTCVGKWITETQGGHGAGYMTTSYARDVEGRLIGFKGHSAAYAGMLDILNVSIPVAGVSFERLWWRIEPAK